MRADYLEEIGELVESLLVPGKLVTKVLSVVTTLSSCERGVAFVVNSGNSLRMVAQVGIFDHSVVGPKDICHQHYRVRFCRSLGVNRLHATHPWTYRESLVCLLLRG